MKANPIALKLRSKTLGVLIKDARQSVCLSIQETAYAVGISEEVYEAYEAGDRAPSLPELEVMAILFDVPMEHFWRGEIIPKTKKLPSELDVKTILPLRQRMIGSLMGRSRTEAGLSLDEIAERSGIPRDKLEAYELANLPIPLPELDILAAELGMQIEELLDQRGSIGKYFARKRTQKDFLELTPELQDFVCKPVNQPYLELAQRLSEMSVEKLRAVAEGLLEITL